MGLESAAWITAGINSHAVTVNGASAAVDLDGSVDWVAIAVRSTAASGTSPSLTLTVQWSVDGTNWYDADATAADTFTAITASGTVAVKRFQTKGRHCRLKETITGTTPSVTYQADITYR